MLLLKYIHYPGRHRCRHRCRRRRRRRRRRADKNVDDSNWHAGQAQPACTCLGSSLSSAYTKNRAWMSTVWVVSTEYMSILDCTLAHHGMRSTVKICEVSQVSQAQTLPPPPFC